jgi:hypothetical protein
MTYKYWNSGNDVAIFRIGEVLEHGISLQDFKHPMLFWQNVENHVRFRKYMVLERLKVRENGQVDSKKHKFSIKSLRN